MNEVGAALRPTRSADLETLLVLLDPNRSGRTPTSDSIPSRSPAARSAGIGLPGTGGRGAHGRCRTSRARRQRPLHPRRRRQGPDRVPRRAAPRRAGVREPSGDRVPGRERGVLDVRGVPGLGGRARAQCRDPRCRGPEQLPSLGDHLAVYEDRLPTFVGALKPIEMRYANDPAWVLKAPVNASSTIGSGCAPTGSSGRSRVHAPPSRTRRTPPSWTRCSPPTAVLGARPDRRRDRQSLDLVPSSVPVRRVGALRDGVSGRGRIAWSRNRSVSSRARRIDRNGGAGRRHSALSGPALSLFGHDGPWPRRGG